MPHAPTPNSDVTHYAVLCRYTTLCAFAERELEASCSRAAVIEDIISGELHRVLKIFAFNPVEGWSRDVTEDIAIEIANALDPSDMITDGLVDFIAAAAGLEYTRGFRVADPTFAAE